jgi:hypothetical protein
MHTMARVLVAASAAIVALLGALHLFHTFRGPGLLPRDRELHARMQEVSPVITRQTTMWRAWIGFNASHGLGLILFGLVFGYLAAVHGAVLLRSCFLLSAGVIVLAGYVLLARRYFFRVPLRAILLAALLFGLGFIATLA